jgi:hypothetical protein
MKKANNAVSTRISAFQRGYRVKASVYLSLALTHFKRSPHLKFVAAGKFQTFEKFARRTTAAAVTETL